MHPNTTVLDIKPRFILVDHFLCAQGGFDLGFDWHQVLGGALDERSQGSFTEVHSYQIPEDLTTSTPGQQLLHDQVGSYRSYTRPILDGSSDFTGKSGAGVALTVGTLFPLSKVFGYLQTGKRHIHYLSAFHTLGCYFPEIRLTVLALGNLRQGDHFIGGLAHLKRSPSMSSLSSGFLPAALAQATGFLLAPKAIRGRWQRAIVAVLRQSLFQGLHPLEQLHKLFVPLRKLFSQGLIFCSELLQFFFGFHTRYSTSFLALLQVP